MKDLHGCNCKADSWSAILDKMPPEKPRLAVKGICTCPTGGFKASLVKATPQGINPKILLLRLVADPPPGATNQVETDFPVTYHESNAPDYETVEILPCNLAVPVKAVS